MALEDPDFLKKLADLENKQWASKALAEVRSQMKDYEYQVVFKTKEEDFLRAIRDLSSAGYNVLPSTTLLQNETYIVLMRRDKGK